MTTILAAFVVSLVLSLVLTPLAGRLGVRFGVLDEPYKRKVHTRSVPRSGGLAILAAFILTLGLSTFLMTHSNRLVLDREISLFLLGGLITFGVGLFDDFHRLGPGVKFLFQIIGASVAFWGGLRIEVLSILGVDLHFGLLNYFVTVFWFVLFINAINLIDGLDGLAAGVTFFASAVLIILSMLKGAYLMAIPFAALAGAVLGFLRYNFNPASIFMGDGGSYFLGYAIAGLSVMGSIKSEIGAAMLIPMVALGVPVFDTILSPIRRFILGKAMFRPDRGHIHHKLVEMGFSTKRVVWIIYGLSFCLCTVAMVLVNVRDEQAGLFLILLGACAVTVMRKLGYLEYLASDKIYGWLKDITDEAGFSRDRRSFLNLQLEIGKSKGLEELWAATCDALDMLKFDMAELCLDGQISIAGGPKWQGAIAGEGHNPKPRFKALCEPGVDKRHTVELIWARDRFDRGSDVCKDCLLKLELPLLDNTNPSCGTLWLVKDLRKDAISHYTLKRVEQLRRTLIGTITKIAGNDLNAKSESCKKEPIPRCVNI